MGKEYREGGNSQFVSIFDNQMFEIRYKELNPNNPKIISRTSTDPKTKVTKTLYVEQFPVLSGHITKLVYKPESDYGKRMVVHISDFETGENFILDMGLFAGKDEWISAGPKSLLLRLGELDLSKPVTLSPYKIAREDKPDKFNTGISVKQNGEKIENPYTKEDIPEVVKEVDEDDNSVSYETKAQNKFYIKILKEQAQRVEDFQESGVATSASHKKTETKSYQGSGVQSTSHLPEKGKTLDTSGVPGDWDSEEQNLPF